MNKYDNNLTEDKALAIIFANTKRQKRVIDLITLANCFEYLNKIYGSQQNVAQKTDLSREMVREFIQILKLPLDVQEIIKTRKIDSIDIAYRLSKIKDEKVLKEIVEKMSELQVHDIRDVISTIQENRGISVNSATKNVLNNKSNNLHIFIIDFSDKNYNSLIKKSKEMNYSPADLIKKIVNNWVEKEDNA